MAGPEEEILLENDYISSLKGVNCSKSYFLSQNMRHIRLYWWWLLPSLTHLLVFALSAAFFSQYRVSHEVCLACLKQDGYKQHSLACEWQDTR